MRRLIAAVTLAAVTLAVAAFAGAATVHSAPHATVAEVGCCFR
jgi:hypothetical protein